MGHCCFTKCFLLFVISSSATVAVQFLPQTNADKTELAKTNHALLQVTIILMRLSQSSPALLNLWIATPFGVAEVKIGVAEKLVFEAPIPVFFLEQGDEVFFIKNSEIKNDKKSPKVCLIKSIILTILI